MNYFWIIVGCIEVLAAGLLLFGLLTTRVARLQRRVPAFAALAAFILCVIGAAVLAVVIGTRLFVVGPHFTVMKNLLIVTTVVYCIGNFTIGWFGLRRPAPDTLPAAATWPWPRLLLAFLVALSLSAVTHWNVTLSVQQRLAREEVEARVMALSALPGRPIDALNAAILYEPVFERLPEHKAVQDDWLDFDKPLDTDDPVLRELLANHRRDLDALVRASARPQCHFGPRQPLDLWGGDGDYDWLGRIVVATRLLVMDTRVKISEGDLKGAANSTSAMFRMARHLDQTPILAGILASRTIDAWAIDCMQALLNHPDLSPETLSGLHLEPLADYRRILRRVSVFAEARATTLVRRIPMAEFDHLGRNLRDEIADPGQRIAAYLWKATSPYFIEHELAVFRSTHRKYREVFDQPWSEASVQFVKFGEVRTRGILTTVLMPKWWEHGAARVVVSNARHRQARLAIALRRCELETGTFPESFDDLIPAYMEEVPLDPTIEEPLKMENVEGGVRLYSAEIESWNPEEYPGNVIKETDGKVEIFLQYRLSRDEYNSKQKHRFELHDSRKGLGMAYFRTNEGNYGKLLYTWGIGPKLHLKEIVVFDSRSGKTIVRTGRDIVLQSAQHMDLDDLGGLAANRGLKNDEYRPDLHFSNHDGETMYLRATDGASLLFPITQSVKAPHQVALAGDAFGKVSEAYIKGLFDGEDRDDTLVKDRQ